MENIMELYDKLSQEDKNEIFNNIFWEKLNVNDILQFLFYKCVKIFLDMNADDLELKSDLLKINKRWILKFELEDLK